MIFKRPYAFLIKHFRLIHFMITGMLIYSVVRFSGIYTYLNSVIASSTNRYDALSYVRYGLLLIIFLVLILFLVVYWLLKYKDKPRRLYVVSIVGYIVIALFMIVLFYYMSDFVRNRDTLLLTMVFQYAIILFMAIRGLGFDIKKFDFNRDAQELNATDSDSEEVEINTKIDTTNLVRGIEKGKRELGYYVKEFKIYVVAILVVVLTILGIKGYSFYKAKYKAYQEGDYIGVINTLKITNSYYKTISNKKYVIIAFDIYKLGKSERFTVENMVLHVDKKTYIPDKTICSKFNNLGNCYKKQYSTSTETNYIISYEVGNIDLNKAYVLYNDSYDNVYKVKLNVKKA